MNAAVNSVSKLTAGSTFADMPCEAYPYSKSIIHVYSACGNNGVSYTEEYKLEEHDKAYTFALPESVIKFDVVPMEDNPREARKALSKKKPGE